MHDMWVVSLSGENPLEEEMVTHSSILAGTILGMEEPGRLHTVCGVAKSCFDGLPAVPAVFKFQQVTETDKGENMNKNEIWGTPLVVQW